MRRIALIAAFFFLWAGHAAARAGETLPVTTAVASVPAALAPADRYFGRLGMSVLGIRNGVRDIAVRIDGIDAGDHDRLANLYHKLVCVEDSLLDLKQQFPSDTWIPALGLGLAEAYMKLPVEDAAVHANDTLDWLIAEYPESHEAASARAARAARFVQPSGDVPIDPLPVP